MVEMTGAGGTSFSELVRVCLQLRATTKRLEKRRLLAEFLRRLRPGEVSPAALLIIGKSFPESETRSLNLGWATVKKSLDAGRQMTLASAPLTITEVQRTLLHIASVSGPDSAKARRRLLDGLLGRASSDEREVILRNIFGEMRHGVSEGVLLEALADASGAPAESVRLANMLGGDIGLVAETVIHGGPEALGRIGLSLFTPIKPMLAEDCGSIEGTLAEHGGRTAAEFKLDGARIQIHKSGGEVRIFSRRLSDVTASLPEIVSFAMTLKGESLLAEGEVVAIDRSGKPLPFQDLMRRFRRVHDLDAAVDEIPLKLHLFDLVYLDGRLLIDEAYESRWNLLTAISPRDLLVERVVADDPALIKLFLKRALDNGHEGLMLKRLDGKYVPGKRGKLWLKLKPAETLDMVVVAAEWGYGRREGWLSNYHLAVKDGDGYAMIGKTFKGLTDDEFRWMTKRLQELRTSEERWGVRARPQVVVEVEYNEIQKSHRYESGFALRFARIKRIREDKGPTEVDTLDRLRSLYEKQFKRKGRVSEP